MTARPKKPPPRPPEAVRLARSAVELARAVPELVPTMLWLIATGGRADIVKAYRMFIPSPEELAAVSSYLEPFAREILVHKQRLLKKVDVVDVAEKGLFAIRVSALQRLGLGLESIAFSYEPRPGRP